MLQGALHIPPDPGSPLAFWSKILFPSHRGAAPRWQRRPAGTSRPDAPSQIWGCRVLPPAAAPEAAPTLPWHGAPTVCRNLAAPGLQPGLFPISPQTSGKLSRLRRTFSVFTEKSTVTYSSQSHKDLTRAKMSFMYISQAFF